MTEDNRKLYRQVHPQYVVEDRLSELIFTLSNEPSILSKSTFIPTERDKGFLSVYNSKVFTSKQAHEDYTQKGLKSACVVSVTVQNCTDLNLGVIDDNIPFHGHSSIDYNSIENKKSIIREVASRLRDKAKIEYIPN